MDFPPDIVRFVELRFGQSGTQEILNLVVDGELCTPRVARSVLFLANGSMSMLRHLITRAEEDVREILVEAEYVTEISEEPMWLRDMSLPFDHDNNLGEHLFLDLQIGGSVERRLPEAQEQRTTLFASRSFALGEVIYTVLPRQLHVDVVLCRRHAARETSIVQLPWTFVADQFAEYIEAIPA